MSADRALAREHLGDVAGGLRYCSGPLVPCMRAGILIREQARHPEAVPCIGCGLRVAIARWVVDARRDPVTGLPFGGHLCTRCDPFMRPIREAQK
jgi:hypothetical protein